MIFVNAITRISVYLYTCIAIYVSLASAFDAAVVRVPMNTSTGLQNITFTDFSANCTLVPCAAIFVITTGISDNVLADDALMSFGFTDGSSQRVVAVHDNDGGTQTDSARETREDRVIQIIDAAGITGSAIFYDWQSNGLRLDVTDAPPSAYLLTVMIMGGTGFQAKAGTIEASGTLNGTADITAPGFTPNAVLISSSRNNLNDTSANTYVFTAGMAVNDGSSTQGSIGCYSTHAATTTNIHAATSSLYAGQVLASGGLDMAIEIGGWDASGFTATTRGVPLASDWPYLALKFGGPSSAVFDIDTRTSIGATSNTLGWRPLAGMVFGTLARAYDVEETDNDATQCMLSLYAGIGQYSHVNTMEDALTSNVNTTSRTNDDGIMMLSPSGTCTTNSCLRGFIILNPTAFTIDYSGVYTDAVRKWIGFAIEDEASVGTRRRGFGLLQ